MVLDAFDVVADGIVGHPIGTDDWGAELQIWPGHSRCRHSATAFALEHGGARQRAMQATVHFQAKPGGRPAVQPGYHDVAAGKISKLEAKLKKMHASLGIAELPSIPSQPAKQDHMEFTQGFKDLVAQGGLPPKADPYKVVEVQAPASKPPETLEAVLKTGSQPASKLPQEAPPSNVQGTAVAATKAPQVPASSSAGAPAAASSEPAPAAAAKSPEVASSSTGGAAAIDTHASAAPAAASSKPTPAVKAAAGSDGHGSSSSSTAASSEPASVVKSEPVEPAVPTISYAEGSPGSSNRKRIPRADVGECTSADGRYTVKVTPDGVRRLYDSHEEEGRLLTRIQCDGETPKGQQGDCGKLSWPCENIHRPFKGYPEDIIAKVKPACREKGWHALFLGLGGGYLQTKLASECASDARLDTLENSPAVVPIAKNMFGFNSSDPKQHLEFGDGMQLMKHHASAADKYDFIFTDQSTGNSKEFLESAHNLLNPGGRLAFSKIGEYKDEWLKSLQDYFTSATPTATGEGNFTLMVTPKAISVNTTGKEAALGAAAHPDAKWHPSEIEKAAGAALSPPGPAEAAAPSKPPVPGTITPEAAAAAFGGKPARIELEITPEQAAAAAASAKANAAEVVAPKSSDVAKVEATAKMGETLKASETDAKVAAVGKEALKKPAGQA